MKSNMKWKTKDGRVMDIKDMTDSHLLNAIAYVKRNVENYRDGAIRAGLQMEGMLQGEMALDSVDSGTRYYETATQKELLTEMGYYKLLAEKRRRKLY